MNYDVYNLPRNMQYSYNLKRDLKQENFEIVTYLFSTYQLTKLSGSLSSSSSLTSAFSSATLSSAAHVVYRRLLNYYWHIHTGALNRLISLTSAFWWPFNQNQNQLVNKNCHVEGRKNNRCSCSIRDLELLFLTCLGLTTGKIMLL